MTLGWITVAVSTAAGAFFTPFLFPSKHPFFSNTYVAGANNKAAVIAIASISLLILAWQLRVSSSARPLPSFPVRPRRRWLAAALLLVLGTTACFGFLVARAHVFWGDEGYFLEQVRTGLRFHRTVYRDFEFPYGPALYWWPASFVLLLGKVGVSETVAYLWSLAALQAGGLLLLFHVEHFLPGRPWAKTTAFLLIAFGFSTPLLGLNYTLFRFVLPLACAVWLSQVERLSRALLAAFSLEILALLVSPELGVAFGLAAVFLGIYRGSGSERAWLALPLAALLGAASFGVLAGRDYFAVISRMGGGEYNLLIQPVPHVLVLLFAAVVLAPLAVVRGLRTDRRMGGIMVAVYGASLGMLPTALGRCDQVHCFSSGIGFYLISFVLLSDGKRIYSGVWTVVFAMTILLGLRANHQLYARRLELAVKDPVRLEDRTIDARALEAMVGQATLTAPRGAPLWLEEELSGAGQYRPGYFRGMQGVWDPAAERRLIAGMRQSQFALVPVEGLENATVIDLGGWRQRAGYGALYHARRPPYVQGALTQQELQTNWVAAGGFGTYVLYRRVS